MNFNAQTIRHFPFLLYIFINIDIYVYINIKPHAPTKKKKQWILIIWRLHICKFIYLLKFICKTKSTLGVSPGLFLDMHRWTKSLSCPKYTLPAKAENDTFLLYPLYYKQTFFLQTSYCQCFTFFLLFSVGSFNKIW